MRGRLAGLLALASAVTGPGVAGASAQSDWDALIEEAPEGVAVRVLESYYPVRGSDPESVSADLRAKSVEVWGRPAIAASIGDVRWPFRFRQRGSACAVRQVGVDLRVTVRLPRWEEESDADPPMRAAWGRYLEELRRHERGHVRLYLEASREIVEAIARVGAVPCAELRARIDGAGNAVMQAFSQDHAAYDADPATPRPVWPPAPGS